MGHCLFACVESRYNGVYPDTGPGGATQRTAGALGTRPQYDRDRPRHGRMRPQYGLRYGRPTRWECVRTWPGQGEGRDTNFVSWLRGPTLGCDTTRRAAIRHSNVPRYGVVCARNSAWCARQGTRVAIQKLQCDRGRRH